jgi:hypothetical protein
VKQFFIAAAEVAANIDRSTYDSEDVGRVLAPTWGTMGFRPT